MADPCDVFSRGPEFHGHHGFGDHIRSPCRDDVYTEHLIGLCTARIFTIASMSIEHALPRARIGNCPTL